MEKPIEKLSKKSHDAHEEHHLENFNEGKDYLFLLKNKDCVYYHINVKGINNILPLLNEKNTWLTIGDFTGFEAKYLIEHNQNATASDISDIYLKEAKSQGLINEYKKINVEQIDFDEDSFDCLFCKEAFHHFPRAYLGVYEMIRVARKGVILIEPLDILLRMSSVLLLKNFCDLFNPYLINKIWKNRFSWEVVGNYVFKISEREIEKIAMGMGLPCIAFKGFNKSTKEIPPQWGNVMGIPTDKKLLQKLERRLHIWNFICKLGIIPHNLLCSIIFKEMPKDDVICDLKKDGYKIIKLPINPYL